MPNLDLVLADIVDPLARENFERLSHFASEAVIGRFEGRFIEVVVLGAVTAMRWPHKLPFVPKDVIVTAANGGSVTWLYGFFDRTDIVFTTTAAMTIRAFIGLYKE